MGKGPAIGWGACFFAAAMAAGDARAQTPPSGDRAPSATNAPSATSARAGLVVLAGHDAADVAWPLAQQLYARPTLRPPALNEAQARVLAGDDPGAGASQSLRDLADTRDAVRGDDAPSRQLLTVIANQMHVRGIVVVRVAPQAGGGAAAPPPDAALTAAPVARVFLADTATFDAASYGPDAARVAPSTPSAPAAKPAWAWSGTVASLDRAYGVSPRSSGVAGGGSPPPAAGPVPGPRAAVSPVPAEPQSHPLYKSPWFWGAIGMAAAVGAGIFLIARDGGSNTIHLQMQVPR
ncbi:MAG TPA: hypothetical protein VNO21_06705 [Polyangiaceae bacterium]|nr:hypothetical protein [Polyangiaceae bacterium]